MSLDVEKLREKARKLLVKKKLHQVLKLYEGSLEKEPNHPDLWCELGSLQASTGDNAGSGVSYFKAAEIYVKAGQDRHALAACKRSVSSGAGIDDARRLLRMLANKIKEEKKNEGMDAKGAEAGASNQSVVSRAARSSRVSVGRVTARPETDYEQVDFTPLPPALSPLIPIQRRQASEFVPEPTNELDLEAYAGSAKPLPFDGKRVPSGLAPPPPPVSYWDELHEGEKKPRARRTTRELAGKPMPKTSVAPAESFMVLSRRDPDMLLSGLRSGVTYGIPQAQYNKLALAAQTPEQRIAAVLSHSLLFEGLSPALLDKHAAAPRRWIARAGEAIAESGSGADSLHTLLSGEVKVLSDHDPPLEIARLRAGALVGEQSFVDTKGMKTRVEVTKNAEVLSLDRSQADELFADHPASLYAMLRVVVERVLDNMLQRSGFFRLFEPGERDEICKRFEILEVADNEVIVPQGTPSKALCLLMSGTLELSHNHPDRRKVKLLLDPGGSFGLESLIDGRPSVFTARTTARAWILLLRRHEYLQIYQKHPNLVRALKDVARRRRQTLAAVNRGELELPEAHWPDFDPGLKDAQLTKIKRERRKKRD
ncbi:MAG: cyclic nucleotide-binding domain-containing protein [bacterium]